jgi:hypothetical protein
VTYNLLFHFKFTFEPVPFKKRIRYWLPTTDLRSDSESSDYAYVYNSLIFGPDNYISVHSLSGTSEESNKY